MFRLILPAVLLAVGLLLSACTDSPRLDASNEQTLAESSEAMAAELDDATAERFTVALAQIYSFGAVQLLVGEKNQQQIREEIHQQLDNRTAEEVIALAEQMQTDFQDELDRQMELFLPQD